MLTPDHPLLQLWRVQPANKSVTDATLTRAIADAYAVIEMQRMRPMTAGSRDLAASFIVRSNVGIDAERMMLVTTIEILLGIGEIAP